MITYEDFLDTYAALGAIISLPAGPFPKSVLLEWNESPREWCERHNIDVNAVVKIVEETPHDNRFIAAVFMLGWEMGAKYK